MSRSFAWRPATPTPPPSGYVSLTVWHLLCDLHGVQDGWTDTLEVLPEHSAWLSGAAAATGHDETKTEILELIDILKREGAVVIEVEH